MGNCIEVKGLGLGFRGSILGVMEALTRSFIALMGFPKIWGTLGVRQTRMSVSRPVVCLVLSWVGRGESLAEP